MEYKTILHIALAGFFSGLFIFLFRYFIIKFLNGIIIKSEEQDKELKKISEKVIRLEEQIKYLLK